jgi:hypothetical protein
MLEQLFGTGAQQRAEGRIPSLDGATGWLNSRPLTSADLRGKVVAVDFCTYTCINWIRTLPYVRAWADRYTARGLVVLGVHTPEFSFERDVDNVRRALHQMRVQYPVALDNDYAIWDAFANRYWPALYLVDTEGRIRHHWYGEGDYERSESVIQDLIAEGGTEGIDDQLVSLDPVDAEAEADWDELRSPETYLGSARTERFRSPGGINANRRHAFAAPERLRLNDWALFGDWAVPLERAVLNAAVGGIAFQFHARDLHLVMGPVTRGASIPFRVRLDGLPPGQARGLDIDEEGAGTATDQRMYQLIRQPSPIAERRFEIEFLEPDIEAFVFTFG